MIQTDILVIGSGLAGLAFALKVADKKKVLVVSKSSIDKTNTSMAQGGIAAVISEGDSFDQHIEDTLVAGAGLCREDVVRRIIEAAPEGIDDLVRWGVKFDAQNKATGKADSTNDKNLDLNREGGHSKRRILHVQDQTGSAIHSALFSKALEHKNITLLENTFALDLVLNHEANPVDTGPRSCVGCHIYNSESGEVSMVYAKTTMLATGGSGKVYLYTSNWSGATGDGIAMAYRAGARIANLEFTQFHPTCLYHPMARTFLISEAVRGEGAKLINSKGQQFAFNYHPKGELAPRDIVARAIDAEMKKSGDDSVFLDITHKSKDFILEKFPQIYETCLKFGYDMTQQPIPVVPAAHYQCGGILVDEYGRTDIKNLYAAGENAQTGLHGANRLASNSLLECLVTADFAAKHIEETWDQIDQIKIENVPKWREVETTDEDEKMLIGHLWDEVRRLMWNYVGIVRSNERLSRAQIRLKYIRHEIEHHFRNFRLDTDLVELRNLALIADLTVQAALHRKESRGTHYSLDYPEKSDRLPMDTLLSPRTDIQRLFYDTFDL